MRTIGMTLGAVMLVVAAACGDHGADVNLGEDWHVENAFDVAFFRESGRVAARPVSRMGASVAWRSDRWSGRITSQQRDAARATAVAALSAGERRMVPQSASTYLSLCCNTDASSPLRLTASGPSPRGINASPGAAWISIRSSAAADTASPA